MERIDTQRINERWKTNTAVEEKRREKKDPKRIFLESDRNLSKRSALRVFCFIFHSFQCPALCLSFVLPQSKMRSNHTSARNSIGSKSFRYCELRIKLINTQYSNAVMIVIYSKSIAFAFTSNPNTHLIIHLPAQWYRVERLIRWLINVWKSNERKRREENIFAYFMWVLDAVRQL